MTMAPGAATTQNKEAMDTEGSKPNPSPPKPSESNEAFTTTSISQLRELLDEAFAYKNPKDRQGKSKVFLDLLHEVESKEDSADRPVDYPVSERGGGGGSLQNICQAVETDQNLHRRRYARQYRGPGASVSARQREGGSLPSNVNSSWTAEWHNDTVKKRGDPMSDGSRVKNSTALIARHPQPRLLSTTIDAQPGPSGHCNADRSSSTTTSEIVVPAFHIIECYNGVGVVKEIHLPPSSDSKKWQDTRRPIAKRDNTTDEIVAADTTWLQEREGPSVYRTSATFEIADDMLAAATNELFQEKHACTPDCNHPKVSSPSKWSDVYCDCMDCFLVYKFAEHRYRPLVAEHTVETYTATASSKNSKKQNKRKQAQKNVATEYQSQNLPGYRGTQDIDDLLNFIENDGQSKGPKQKSLPKNKASDKKHPKSLHKASSLEELSQRNIDDLTVNLETDRSRPDPMIPRSESQSNLTTQFNMLSCDQQESDDDSNLNEFQTVRKKHRKKRANVATIKRPRCRSILPRPQRRKSTSSMPHSEMSADSDTDSVHSLPTHGSASYTDCDSSSGPSHCSPLDAKSLNQEFPSLPVKHFPRTEPNNKIIEGKNSDAAAEPEGPPSVAEQKYAHSIGNIQKDVKPVLSDTTSTSADLLSKQDSSHTGKELSGHKSSEASCSYVTTATEPSRQQLPEVARQKVIVAEPARENKPKTRSKSVGPNSQPPVVLMDERRSHDNAVSEITFGFEVNQQLLTQSEQSNTGNKNSDTHISSSNMPPLTTLHSRPITSMQTSEHPGSISSLPRDLNKAVSSVCLQSSSAPPPSVNEAQSDEQQSYTTKPVGSKHSRSSMTTSTSSLSSMTPPSGMSQGSPSGSPDVSPRASTVASPSAIDNSTNKFETSGDNDIAIDERRPPRPVSQPWGPELQIMHLPLVINVLPHGRWTPPQWSHPPPVPGPYQFQRPPRVAFDPARNHRPSIREDRRLRSRNYERTDNFKDRKEASLFVPKLSRGSSEDKSSLSNTSRRVSDVQTSTDDLESAMANGLTQPARSLCFPPAQDTMPSYPVLPSDQSISPMYPVHGHMYGPIPDPHLVYPSMPGQMNYPSMPAYPVPPPHCYPVPQQNISSASSETPISDWARRSNNAHAYSTGASNMHYDQEPSAAPIPMYYPPSYNQLVYSLSNRFEEISNYSDTVYFSQDDQELNALMMRTAEQRKANGSSKYFKSKDKP